MNLIFSSFQLAASFILNCCRKSSDSVFNLVVSTDYSISRWK